jgi:glucose dehydrogenase
MPLAQFTFTNGVAERNRKGTPTKAILWGNRNGFFYVLDRTNGPHDPYDYDSARGLEVPLERAGVRLSPYERGQRRPRTSHGITPLTVGLLRRDDVDWRTRRFWRVRRVI